MAPQSPEWWAYGWIYLFAALIGFAATVAEPALIAVAYKANQVSGGTISQWGLRLAVALGVALGIALGAFRIVTGTPLIAYIVAGDYPPRLRFWRGHHVFSDSSTGGGSGPGPFRNHPGT
jgi:hypothetical protein